MAASKIEQTIEKVVDERIGNYFDVFTPTPKKWLKPREAAEYTGVSLAQLEIWRRNATGGPKFVQKGRIVRYNVDDLDVFLRTEEVR